VTDPALSSPDVIGSSPAPETEITLGDVWRAVWRRRRWVFGAPFATAVLALAATYLMCPTFTAQTVFLPPQQQQSIGASAVASLGAVANLAGGLASLHAPADQYVAMMQSASVADRLIDRFDLMKVYGASLRVDARKMLAENSHFTVGKKDGLVTVEVDDHDPKRAAAMANQYVEELHRLTDTLAVTEAQQRRKFFEQLLKQTEDRLIDAQQALQASGLTEGALKAEPKAIADAYARLRAQVTAAEVKLQTMRGLLTDNAPEVLAQKTTLDALRAQLAALEHNNSQASGGADYLTKYREFKYQETLFELLAKQYELARVDESREGALIQVIDPATVPERKSKPKRGYIALGTWFLTLLVLAGWAVATRERKD
jgi:uncharacterized protein involved in exopolysaccharide biosynthesis